jgi:hypothetical protein
MRRAQRITASGRVRVSASNFSEKNKISGQPNNKIPSLAKDQRCTAQAAGNISLNP